MSHAVATPASTAANATPEATNLREISPQQWKSGIAAWLGWLFDGLDMHLYTLVAASFVATLVNTPVGDPKAKIYSGWIQAAFLVGWALGGAFFGRIGDKLGRSRALSLTILTYAIFTGLSFFVETWWQLLICRFLAALGVGGEWAVGSSLLSETWPKKWRAWIAAVLQTGVNLGVLLACGAVAILTYIPNYQDRWVFLVGILPAFMVFWIRRNVPEPEEWHAAKTAAAGAAPGVRDLFSPAIRGTTFRVLAICALSLTGWWAFLFWHAQHLRTLAEVKSWTPAQVQQLVTTVFFLVMAVSIFGNFAASWFARRLGYPKTIALMCGMFAVSIFYSYIVPRSSGAMIVLLPIVGFCSGVFGLFTMYLPPLFPTLLRTTGAGFCYNIGRIFAAAGTVLFGIFSTVTDLRVALLYVSFIFIPATFVALLLPELRNEDGTPG